VRVGSGRKWIYGRAKWWGYDISGVEPSATTVLVEYKQKVEEMQITTAVYCDTGRY
jgi:hypothetical protein